MSIIPPIPPLPPPTGITTQINVNRMKPPISTQDLKVISHEVAVINWIDPTTITIPTPALTPPFPAGGFSGVGPPYPLSIPRPFPMHPWTEAVLAISMSANSSPPAIFPDRSALFSWLDSKEHRGGLFLSAWIQFDQSGSITMTEVDQYLIDPGWTPFVRIGDGYGRGELHPPPPMPKIISGGISSNFVDWQLGPVFVRLGSAGQSTNAIMTNRQSPYLVYSNIVLRLQTSAPFFSLVNTPVSLLTPSPSITCNYEFPTYDWYTTNPATGSLTRLTSLSPRMSVLGFINQGIRLNPLGP